MQYKSLWIKASTECINVNESHCVCLCGPGVGGAGGVPGLIAGAGELSCKSTLLDT